MKKTILLLILLFGIYYMIGNNFENYIIPDESIRIRIIPNSNSDYDQVIKNKVRENLEEEMYFLLKDVRGIDNARDIINSNMNIIDSNVGNTLFSSKYDLPYSIAYGMNYFPEKKYKGVVYQEGNYESLLVTLGSGEGDNWWCVLFPPLCIMEVDEAKNVEYHVFVKDLIEKYLK